MTSGCVEVLQYSMRQVRPYTAGRELQSARGETRTTLSHITRPYSARNETLKRIIQVIQKTLSRGAQQALSRSNSKPKHQKSKRKVYEFTHWKIERERSKRQRQIPQYKTQFAIAINTAPQSTPTSTRSSKNVFLSSCDFEEFVPYMQQQGNFRDVKSPAKRSRPSMKKVTRKRKILKDCEKQNQMEIKKTGQQSLIEKWQSDPPLLNLSGLLDQQIR